MIITSDKFAKKNSMSVISLKNIKKTYQMGKELVYALRDITTSIEANEYVALMGPLVPANPHS